MKAFLSTIHAVCRADGWVHVCDVWPRARDPHSTQAAAEAAGRERAKQENTEHIVHDADGTIEQRISYRNPADSSTGERDQ
jgi:hypothetical protein